MPLYEYQCLSCGKRTEVLQRFAEAPLTVCPACGGELKKLISAPAVQFKGSGWYVTDYANKGSGKSGSSEGRDKGDSDSGKKETAASEAKPSGESSGGSGSSSSSASSGGSGGSSSGSGASGGSGSSGE
jgi:putative FmdB family regulatory protein